MDRVKNFLSGVAIVLMAALAAPQSFAGENAESGGAEAIVSRHIEVFLARDWDAAIQDYCDDAVFVLPGGPIQGKPAILAFLRSLDAQRPVAHFTATQIPATSNIGVEDWVMNAGQPGALKGRDIFVIQHGKICFQTTIQLGPAAP